MQVTAVYPGTFDPLTVGHIDVASRASRMFDHVVVAVAASRGKHPFFTLEERSDMARLVLSELPNVSVREFSGLLVDFVQQIDCSVIVRGLRAISDFDYEVQIAGVNRHLAPRVETVFIAAAQEYTFLSSSVVRDVARHGGDVTDFVHPVVVEAFGRKLPEPHQQNPA